jgi:hypothetical protein
LSARRIGSPLLAIARYTKSGASQGGVQRGGRRVERRSAEGDAIEFQRGSRQILLDGIWMVAVGDYTESVVEFVMAKRRL